MCLIWDKCTVDITNNTTSPLTLTSSSTSVGTWETEPPPSIAAGATDSFAGRCTCGALEGCKGEAVYTLQDGTTLNINYYTAYVYGIDDNSQYNVGFGGSRAGSYTNTTNDPQTSGSNGGAGKRVTWTLSVDYA